jgi:hypothetical protein
MGHWGIGALGTGHWALGHCGIVALWHWPHRMHATSTVKLCSATLTWGRVKIRGEGQGQG